MKRREFFGVPAMVLAGMSTYARDLTSEAEPGPSGAITDVAGIKVGHSTRTDRPTGCTVLLAEEGATGGVDQRGGAPGTRDTDLLNPVNSVEKLNAIMLSGGSAYGLATADGAMRYLEEKGIGLPLGRGRDGAPRVVPIVPAAILLDLGFGGDWKIRPTAENGYQACQAATSKPPEQGCVGAGAGATVGWLLGQDRRMKGGFGTASIRLPNGIVIGAMVATNGAGDIWDHIRGKLIAGARTEDGKHLADVMKVMREGKLPIRPARVVENTTLGAIAVNVELTKPQITKVTQMCTDGYALAIRPVHTPGDGDTIFGAATGKLKLPPRELDPLIGVIGALAADVMAQAIVSAVLHAKGTPQIPSVSDLAAMK
jgi:L-aminopeptidase/D-esterase-like protein